MLSKNHRKFFVDGRLEFAFFYDESIKDKKKILEEFFNCKDWKYMKNYCSWEVKDTQFNKDLSEVYINLKTAKEPK